MLELLVGAYMMILAGFLYGVSKLVKKIHVLEQEAEDRGIIVDEDIDEMVRLTRENPDLSEEFIRGLIERKKQVEQGEVETIKWDAEEFLRGK